MDIRIEALEGPTPPGETFVSMRIGDYQKQSRFGSFKSYRFPHDDGNGFARLEVFQRVGHLSVSLEKLRSNDQDVQVPLEIQGLKFLPLRVGLQKNSAEDKSKAKVKTRLDAAQRYLAQHQLEEIIADAMREVIHEKPDDPYTFLSNEIMKHAKKPAFLPPLRNENQKELPPKPPNAARPKPNANERLPPINAPGGSAAELNSLRVEARDVLLQSAKDGSLAKALASVSSDDVDMTELRKETALALIHAAKDGSLNVALQETVFASKEAELEELRQQARATLLQGARDGSLQDALLNSKEEASVEAVRLQARDALLRSAKDGSLAAALQTQASIEDQLKVEDLRIQARDALLRASMSGALDQVLSQGKSPKKSQQAASATELPHFKFKPSVGSWLVKKPHQVPKPWYYENVAVVEAEDEKVVKNLQAVIAEKDGEIAALKAKLRETSLDAPPPLPSQAQSPPPLPPKAVQGAEQSMKATPASLTNFRQYYADHVHSVGSDAMEKLYSKFPSQPKPAPKAPAEEAQPKFALRPSVGTWLAPAPKRAAPTGSASSATPAKPKTPFALKPSVGTWLSFKTTDERPKSSSILERTHSKLLAMEREDLIKGYEKEIKKRDQEIDALKHTMKA
ncbi:unnamed protein product [Durusdinium trenchii]|uniref:Uncharacterized protein n=1 Tax=Durusdinium trenchii TaxID=1381693 RepID=A0ABP0KC26_9DINO